MTTEGLKNIINDLFSLKDIKIVIFSIVLEEGHLVSCICIYEAKSRDSSIENIIKQKTSRIDGKLIDPWQLWRCSSYFNSLTEFKSTFSKTDNVLTIQRR